MSSRDLDKNNRPPCYIYELPYREKKMVCNILDINDKWEELGGMYMKYDCGTLYKISKAVIRNRSPSEELLCLWGTQNHTILDLFVLLAKMHHFQAMRIIKPFIDPKYHHLIYEGEDHMSQLVPMNDSETLKDHLVYNGMKNSSKTSNEKYRMGQNNKETDSKVNDIENYNNGRDKSQHATSSTTVAPELCTMHISYKELESATNGWDKNNILGKGGFGIVFKGTWKNTAVAIKRLEPQRNDEEEFDVLEGQRQQSIKELRYLNSYRHDNILPLYGYSIGGERSCLVYQYMPNGSLEDRIQCRNRSKPLSWFLRHKVATGTARGLQFLHGMDKPLVHGDIKSANILLDPYFEPRIGDFGLAREGPLEQYTHVKVSKVHGTRPYLPDEFLRGKKFSTKVDTYSFGVVLFEIATGLRAYDDARPKKFLKDYVDEYDENRVCDLIDVKAGADDAHTFPAIIALGKWCVRTRPKDRPDMVQVLRQLDGMMAARDMANKAQFLVRQNSVTPSTPYEMQLLHDHHTQMRRLSFSPSASYHPQPWLFASHVANNNNNIGAPVATRRSTSPSTQGVISDSHPVQGRMSAIPAAGTINNDLENSPPAKVSQIGNSSAYPPYPPPPYINVYPPSVVHRLPSLISKSSDYSSSMSNLQSEQEISTYSENPNNNNNNDNIATSREQPTDIRLNHSLANDNFNYHLDPMIPMISELKITQNSTEQRASQ